MARLTPAKRKKVKRRAQKEAARENAPATQAAQAAGRATIGQANRDYGREVASAQGAARVENRQLNRMLSNIADTGLKGKYAAQTANELRARKLEATSGVPYAIADANRARRDVVQTARADMASAQAEAAAAEQEAFGTKFNDLLEQARKAKTQRIKEREDEAEDDKGRARGVKNALIVADVALRNAKPKDYNGFLADPAAFATGVAKKAEGADPVDARKAVAILFKKIRAQENRAAKSVFESVWGQQDWPKKR